MTALNTQVLIVGAGPTGLTLALWLKKLGVEIRIIDKSSAPGTTSRALAVQARILEFHRQIGIIDDVLAAGIRMNQLTIHTPGRVRARLKLSDFGRGLSPYSFAFALPQDVHEKVLIDHLRRLGVEVERETELAGFEDDGRGVTAKLRKGDTVEFVRADYLAGCDGARSAVRHALQIGFPGGTYEQSFYVADVEGTGDVTQNGMDSTVSQYGFALVMPVRQLGSLRLIGVVPKAHEADDNITFESIRAEIERDTGVTVNKVNWFSTYRIHHRVADRFRVGRAFLAGDAGHIHSPAGGQGMNTGMGDVINLAWKLAAVLQGRAEPSLLDTYEPERMAFARTLIKSTDTAFKIITTRNWLVGLWRRHIMPRMLATVMSTHRGSRFFFRMISQIAISYRDSAISAGKVGEIHGGDRLPYIVAAGGDNHQPLTSLDWQAHVYGSPELAFHAAMAEAGIPLHIFAWSPAAEAAGFTRNAAYLIRPDGHVALAHASQDPELFRRYLASLRIQPRFAAGERRENGEKTVFVADRAAQLRRRHTAFVE